MTLQLFDFIAQCVTKFLAETFSSENNASKEPLPLGFVFPFSCRQTRLDKVRGRALSQAVAQHSTAAVGKGTFLVPEVNGSAACSPQAELLSWSKGFSCSGVVGKDVVQLLQAAINKQEAGANGSGGHWLPSWRGRKSSQAAPGHHVEVVALMNDTVGTMMTCSMEGRPCEVAMVAGEAWAP